MYRTRLFIMYLTCLALLFTSDPARATAEEKSNIVLYTALTATTPQIPLWATINEGWPENGSVSVEYWKTLDDLRGTILAGKGDIWVGHLEGFAQAALRGAPVQLVAVTGWKKFYFIGPKTSTAHDITSLAAELGQMDQPLAVAPQDSPGLAILENIKQRGGPSFAIAAMQPQQLMLEMLRGTRQFALLPEPLVSTILAKKPELQILTSLEEEFSLLYGGLTRMPLVGIAVNTKFAENEPETVQKFVSAMQRHAALLFADPEAAIGVLPEDVKNSVGEDIIRNSFSRDMILVVPASDAKEEISSFLRMVLPKTDPTKIDTLIDGPFLFRR